MSFDEASFEAIYGNLLFTDSEVRDSFRAAENCLKRGWLMGQSSLALNHSNETTSAIHLENLQNYQQFSTKNIDKYAKECLNLLPEERSSGDVEIILDADEFGKHLNISCLGEFADCKTEKLSKADVESLFQVEAQIPNVQCNKRTHQDDGTKSSSKFIFRESNERQSVRTAVETAPNSARLMDSNRNLFDSFASKKLESRNGNMTERVTFPTHSDDLHPKIAGPQRPQPTVDKTTSFVPKLQSHSRHNYQPHEEPLLSYGITKKAAETDYVQPPPGNSFITGTEALIRQNMQKNGKTSHQPSNQPFNQPSNQPLLSYGVSTKTLGLSSAQRRSVTSKFVPPIPVETNQRMESTTYNSSNGDPDRLQHIDPKMIELIRSEIMDQSSPCDWDDIAGLVYAKATIQEAIILPMLRPDLFTGLRRPPRGILLFGPPGTGKTLIGRCIASKSKSTFFSISASSLTSKWIGDGEKMVRALFAVASAHQPAVIFIDEIDSLLSARSDTEHESSRRLKTEFLVQIDGARTSEDERILIVGATNRPQELDEAARRRLTKRLYIPLPELEARIQILTILLKKERNQISSEEIAEIGRLTDGFSGADMKTLCHEASMGPIRAIRIEEMESISLNDVRYINFSDFVNALKRVRASVSQNDLTQYVKWDQTYGSSGASA